MFLDRGLGNGEKLSTCKCRKFFGTYIFSYKPALIASCFIEGPLVSLTEKDEVTLEKIACRMAWLPDPGIAVTKIFWNLSLNAEDGKCYEVLRVKTPPLK